MSEEKKYHEVHCVRCGESFDSAYMAFDLDTIIRRGVEMEREADEEKKLLQSIRLGLYVDYDELQTRFHVTETAAQLRVCVGDIIEMLQERYLVNLYDFMSEEDILGDGFATREFRQFCDRLSYFEQSKDEDRKKKQNLIERLCRYFLGKRKREVILECEIQIQFVENDIGGNYASGLIVKYEGGERYGYFENMVCPHCGTPLHMEAGKYHEYLIGMLGSSRVGKTAYLASLVETLRPLNGKSRTPEITVISDGSSGWKKFEKEILEPYRAGKKIPKTAVTEEMASLFTVVIKSGNKKNLFTFIDMPGEAFTGEINYILEKRPILRKTDLFWFCVAPRQIDANLKTGGKPEAGGDYTEEDIFHVLSGMGPVLKYINSKSGIRAAVVLTKSDLVSEDYRLFEPEQEETLPLEENLQFRWDRYVNNAANVKRYFDAPHVADLSGNFRDMFKAYNYFAIASYGRKLADGEAGGNLPSHVADPFFWTLAALGILETVSYGPRMVRKGFRRTSELGVWPVEEAYLYCRE